MIQVKRMDPTVVVQVKRVDPTGHRRAVGHVNRGEHGSGFEMLDVPMYPAPDFDFRDWRTTRGLTLGQVARMLGWRVSDVSGLEHGYTRPAEGWAALVTYLQEKIG